MLAMLSSTRRIAGVKHDKGDDGAAGEDEGGVPVGVGGSGGVSVSVDIGEGIARAES